MRGFGEPGFTDGFIRSVGIEPDDVTALRYRGYGCPGPTRIEPVTGSRNATTSTTGVTTTAAGAFRGAASLSRRHRRAADIAVSDTWPGAHPPGGERNGSWGECGDRSHGRWEELLAAAEAAGALTIERDVTVDDMSDYQPHQVRKKHTAALRHEEMANAGRIRPQTARLRIDELAATVPVDIRASQIDGTPTRIETGKASLPTPE